MVQPGNTLTPLGQAGPADLKYRLHPVGRARLWRGLEARARSSLENSGTVPIGLKMGAGTESDGSCPQRAWGSSVLDMTFRERLVEHSYSVPI